MEVVMPKDFTPVKDVAKRLDEWFTPGEGCDPTMDEIIGDVTLLEQQKLWFEAECKRLQAQLDERYDHPRCGECDNEKVCIVHDCPVNHYEGQFCGDCGKCKNPQDRDHGGPCDSCKCDYSKHHGDIACICNSLDGFHGHECWTQ